MTKFKIAYATTHLASRIKEAIAGLARNTASCVREGEVSSCF